jgi:AcrR family transcriptional regulator
MTSEAPTPPPSRAERQRRTRTALIHAAREVFSRDGYHGASLETIANEAGFSKGAVYSNFESKAALFLAVMDRNLEATRGGPWDPFDPLGSDEPAVDGATPEAATEALRTFGLASLEFIATAARDPELASALAARVQVLLEVFTQLAGASRPDDERLPAAEVGALLAALDQGVTLLALSGVAAMDARLLRIGLQRLLDPRRAADAPLPPPGPVGLPAIHDRELQRRMLQDRRRNG